MSTDRKRSKRYRIGASHLPGVLVEFNSEIYPGDPTPLDTDVVIHEGGILCCITWKDIEPFKQELQAVIDKYLI
jgi:hypothetical protein